jgi:hypothetical protein
MFQKNRRPGPGLFCLPLLLFLSIFLLCGCSPRIQIEVTEDGKTAFHISSTVKPQTAEIIRSVSAMGRGSPVLNVEAVKSSFLEAGFTAVSAVSMDGISLQADAAAESASRVFSVLNKAVVYNREGREFQLILSTETVPEILSLLPRETRGYLDLLMAPLFTGEALSGAEYTEMIAAVYGNTIARELSESVFEFTFTAPGAILSCDGPPSVRIERSGQRNATFVIPLSALLVLRTQAVCRVQWG